MSIKSGLKKVYRILREQIYCLATYISPTLNTSMRYRKVFGKKLNLHNPQSFNEKLLWLKLNRYNNDPLVIQCADKYLVRDYIKQCGCEGILNDLIGIWDHAKDIPWNTLPEKFVLKWNFGAGMNIICTDKSKYDFDDVVTQMNKWEHNKCWLSHSEMQYKYIPRKIICERYLEYEKGRTIPDYKVYCFHGQPKAILVMQDRGQGNVKSEFYDTDWNILDNSGKYSAPATATPKPICFDRLLNISAKLSKPFPFVRVDFYVIGEDIYFGELTFTPAGGLYTSQTKIDGKEMAEFLHID